MTNIYPGFRKIIDNCPDIIVIQDFQQHENVKTVKQLFDLYKATLNTSSFRNTSSSFVKHVVPALGGPSPQKDRASESEIATALEFLDSVPLSRLENIPQLLEEYFVQQNLDKDKRRNPRSYLNQLIEWGREEGFIKAIEENQQVFYRFKEVNKSRPYVDDTQLMEGRPYWANKIILGGFDEDFVVLEPNSKSYVSLPNYIPEIKQTIPFDWHLSIQQSHLLLIAVYWVEIEKRQPSMFLANPVLEQELPVFLTFLQERLHNREVTVIRDGETILRFLGWFHRQGGNSLALLRLTSIISLISPQLKLKPSQFRGKKDAHNRFLMAKAEAAEDMEEATEDTVILIEKYLSSCQLSCQAQINCLKGFVNLAKFLYRDETRDFKPKRGFKDIRLIEVLRSKETDLEVESKDKSETVMPRHARMVPWPTYLKVVEKHRIEFEQVYRFHVRHTRLDSQGRTPIEKVKRTDWARACDLRQFLILAIYAAMPPGRAREYYELEIGRTLVQGIYQNGVFIPVDKMSHPDQAEWWLFLAPADYKTGKKYGSWQSKLPNIKYGNGKYLYDYIQEWVDKWRLIFKPKNHNRLFTTLGGKPLSGPNLKSIVESGTNRFTGVRVNPQSLRKMFVTYLKERGATEAELDSAAAVMRHSRATQSKIYDQQNLHSKLQPSLDLAQKLAEEFSEEFEKKLQASEDNKE